MIAQEIEDIYAPYINKQLFKITTIEGKQFRLPEKYKPFKIVGSGAYGVVCAAKDLSVTSTNEKDKIVAIKKITQKDCSRVLYKRILRQMKILRNLKNKNVVKLKDIVLPESRSSFTHLYLVFEYCNSDLHTAIRGEFLSLDHVKYFTLQIIKGISFLHCNKILHRDLKPRNILVTNECGLKICDFGLSRFIPKAIKEDNLTDYVATRWYRAPQLLLGFKDYTQAVDIWSIGCLIAEMILRKAIFPGNNSSRQWELIIEFTGFHKQDIAGFSEEIQEFLLSLFKTERRGNIQFLFDVCPEGADLVSKMLKLDPHHRIKLQQALEHPFMAQYSKNIKAEQICPINPLQFEFENEQISKEQLKDMIYEQILLYHDKKFAEEYKAKIDSEKSVISHILNKHTVDICEDDSMEEHF